MQGEFRWELERPSPGPADCGRYGAYEAQAEVAKEAGQGVGGGHTTDSTRGQQNPHGGKGPCFHDAARAATHAGMAVPQARPNSPGGHKPVDKVRRLQRRLYRAAKASPTPVPPYADGERGRKAV